MSDQQEGQQAQDAQYDAQQDSQLQTPQADQPVPTEPERQEQEQPVVDGPTAEVGPSGQPAEGTVAPADFPTNEDLHAQEDQRQQELESAQREHNQRTGGGEVHEGELQAQRDEHNRRTGGGQPSDAA